MTHSTKNAIELKCETRMLQGDHGKIMRAKSPAMYHDALAAHALMKAIEEYREHKKDFKMDEDLDTGLYALDWVSKRAAEILESEYGIKP